MVSGICRLSAIRGISHTSQIGFKSAFLPPIIIFNQWSPYQLDVQLDDLPSDFREIAETIGLDPALKLVQARGGEGVYIPKFEKVCRAATCQCTQLTGLILPSFLDLFHFI